MSILYIGAIFWTIGYDTLYAMQDYEDDMHTGVKSTVTKMKGNSGLFAACAYLISSIIISGALLLNNFNIVITILVFALGIWQTYYAYNTKINETHKFNKGFNNSNLCGFLVWLSMIINLFIIN